jgi:hypothetical protein
MRLLHHATLSEMPDKYAEAWKKYGPKPPDPNTGNAKDTQQSQERELYKRRQDASRDFHELFPFLPATEQLCSWQTKGGVEM